MTLDRISRTWSRLANSRQTRLQGAKRILLGLVSAIVLIGASLVACMYLFPAKFAHAAIAGWRRAAGLVRREINLPSGLHYVYLEGGQGEPLVLLHGFGANKDAFLAVARLLTAHYRLIVPDHIGFGESAHPLDSDYSPPAQVEHLRELARSLGLSKVHLGGSSMGGQIALVYAALYTNEVASLWLLNPAGLWTAPQSELFRIIKETGRNPLLVQTQDDFDQLFPFTMTKVPPIPRPVMRVFAQERIRNFKLEERIFPQIAAYSVEERIRGLATPALVAWGDQDRTLHIQTVDLLRKLIPGVQVRMMHGIGHLPMVEDPPRAAQDYVDFRASLARHQ